MAGRSVHLRSRRRRALWRKGVGLAQSTGSREWFDEDGVGRTAVEHGRRRRGAAAAFRSPAFPAKGCRTWAKETRTSTSRPRGSNLSTWSGWRSSGGSCRRRGELGRLRRATAWGGSNSGERRGRSWISSGQGLVEEVAKQLA
jgi:hypothetical protein